MKVMETFPDPSAIETLDSRIIDDFTEVLLPELTRDPKTGEAGQFDRDEVAANLARVIDSPNTTLLGITEQGHVTSTATVNFTPTLTHEDGGTTWIDDVVTHPELQGRGRSKKVMRMAELTAYGTAAEVYLTSSAHRGAARAGYEKSGYTLLNEVSGPERRVVFRNTHVAERALSTTVDAEALDEHFTPHDVGRLATLLGAAPSLIERNLARAVASPNTEVLVTRGRDDAITGTAVANLTPIPVGYKPWINELSGERIGDILEVLAGAETWIGKNYTYGNIVAHPDATVAHSEGWDQRPSGLYVKRLDGPAVTGVVV